MALPTNRQTFDIIYASDINAIAEAVNTHSDNIANLGTQYVKTAGNSVLTSTENGDVLEINTSSTSSLSSGLEINLSGTSTSADGIRILFDEDPAWGDFLKFTKAGVDVFEVDSDGVIQKGEVPLTILDTATANNGEVLTINGSGNPVWEDQIEHVYFSLKNGWSHYGSTYGSVYYTKVAGGLVVLEGLVSSGGATGDIIATFPVGFRPQYRRMYAMSNGSGTSRIDVHANGDIEIQDSTYPGFVSLSGISFYAAG